MGLQEPGQDLPGGGGGQRQNSRAGARHAELFPGRITPLGETIGVQDDEVAGLQRYSSLPVGCVAVDTQRQAVTSKLREPLTVGPVE